MRSFVTLLLLVLLAMSATSASAVVVHDESVNGDLATNPAAPTSINFAALSSTIRGTTGNVGGVVDRDYITFTLAPDRVLSALYLRGISPDNLAFASFNSGATSFVPSAATSASFLAGIHIAAPQIGSNLMPLFVSSSVTTNSLPTSFLGPGTYCFLIQQTSPITQSYELEFEVAFVLPTHERSWAAIKRLYRD